MPRKTNQLSRDQGEKLSSHSIALKLVVRISNDHWNFVNKYPTLKLSLMSNTHFHSFFSWNTSEVIEQKDMYYTFHAFCH